MRSPLNGAFRRSGVPVGLLLAATLATGGAQEEAVDSWRVAALDAADLLDHGSPVAARARAQEALDLLLVDLDRPDDRRDLRRGMALHLASLLMHLQAQCADPGRIASDLAAAASRCDDAFVRAGLDEYAWRTRQAIGDWTPVARAGAVRAWAVIGPFDNERGGGYRTPYPPEGGIDWDAPCRGKERDVAWRPVPGDAEVVQMDDLMDPCEQALGYAVTHIRCDAAADAAIQIGSDESYKLWVNGRLVLERDVRRPYWPDQDVVGVRLQAGWNRILVKTCDREGPWAFGLRITTPDGAPLVGSTSQAIVRDTTIPPPDDAPLPTVDPGPVAALGRWVERHPDDAHARVALAGLLQERHAHDEGEHPARDLLDAGLATAPDDVRILYARSRVSAEAAQMDAERNENRRREFLDRVVAADPGHVSALVQLSHYQSSALGNLDLARRLSDRAVAAGPESAIAWQQRLDIMQSLGWGPERYRAVRALPAAIRDAPCLLGHRILAAREWEDGASVDALLSLPGAPSDERARRRLQGERCTDYLSDSERYQSAFPCVVGPILHRARVLSGRGRHDDARDALADAACVAPHNASIYREIGMAETRAGRSDEARAAFAESLRLRPSDRDLASYLEHLHRDRIPIEERVRAPIGPLIAAAREAIPASDDPFVWILRREHTFVRRDGTQSRVRHWVREVRTEAGVEMLRTHVLQHDPAQERVRIAAATAHRPDGSTLQARVLSMPGLAGAQFPSLAVGDVVEILDRVDETEQGFFGDYFGTRVAFAEDQPAYRLEFSVTAPVDRPLHVHATGGLIAPETTIDESDGTVRRTWTAGPTPRLPREPGRPPLAEMAPLVQISTYDSWERFGAWYGDLIRHQSEPDDALRAKARELAQGCTTPEETVRALYNFVANDIEYVAWEFGIHGWKPYTASQVLANGFGDCKDKANLLCTMLRLHDIEAYPVLIQSTDDGARGREDLTLPLMEHFNHCIAVARLGDGRTLWLDGTAQGHPWDALPDSDQSATVFVVTPGGGRIERIPDRDPASCAAELSYEADVRADLGATVRVTLRATGTRAAILRHVLNLEGRRQEILESAHAGVCPGARVTLGEWPDLDDPDAPVVLSYSLDVSRFLRADGADRWRVPMPEEFFLPETFTTFTSLPDRTTDLLLGSGWTSVTCGVVRLPPGFVFSSGGATFSEDGPVASFRQASELSEPGRLQFEQEFVLRSPRVPCDEYAAFRDFCTRCDDARRQHPTVERTRTPE